MRKILVETSARHIHLSDEDLAILAGPDYKLEAKENGELSQPGQFASTLRLSIVGPRNRMDRVIVLGPTRKATQIEVSATDARTIGVKAPVRESGNIANSAPIKIIGPVGEIEVPEGTIIAKRHIHMTPKDAEDFAVSNGDVVGVRVRSDERSLVFEDVVVRVSDRFSLAMHIDTDESNAAGLSGEVYGELLKLN